MLMVRRAHGIPTIVLHSTPAVLHTNPVLRLPRTTHLMRQRQGSTARLLLATLMHLLQALGMANIRLPVPEHQLQAASPRHQEHGMQRRPLRTMGRDTIDMVCN